MVISKHTRFSKKFCGRIRDVKYTRKDESASINCSNVTIPIYKLYVIECLYYDSFGEGSTCVINLRRTLFGCGTFRISMDPSGFLKEFPGNHVFLDLEFVSFSCTG